MQFKKDLTVIRLREVLNYDPVTGIFTWKVSLAKNKIVFVGDVAGTFKKKKNYIAIGIDCTQYYAHRLAWFYMTGEWPKEMIDHIDCNGSNNKWTNLREATNSENLRNRKRNKNNTTGYKGIYKNRDGYMVRIHIGTFKTLEEAKEKYLEAINRYRGQFARAA